MSTITQGKDKFSNPMGQYEIKLCENVNILPNDANFLRLQHTMIPLITRSLFENNINFIPGKDSTLVQDLRFESKNRP